MKAEQQNKPTNVYEDDNCWCDCEKDHDVKFFDDFDIQYYGEHKLPVEKHHYACCVCQKIKQIG